MALEGNPAIYDDLMRFKPEGLSPNAWAVLAGVSRTVWSDMRRHGNPSRRTLEKLLTAAGSSLAEFEALRVRTTHDIGTETRPGLADRRPAWGQAQLPPLPLIPARTAGCWGDPRQRIDLTELCSGEKPESVPRPPSLARDPRAYAIIIAGDSMWPRFRSGRRVAISPASALVESDDVLVKLKPAAVPGADRQAGVVVLIKELVRRTPTSIRLRQFNPDVIFDVATVDVDRIEKVVGELI